MKIIYAEDILQDGFEQCKMTLHDDYEGVAIATLIRRCATETSQKSVLYIHGFNDYFFQAEMAHEFNNNGFNFYALDLRKYGRSYLPHQKLNDVRDLKKYYEEIISALEIIRAEGNEKVLLFGHSTGGLILTLFAKNYSNKKLFDGLILNSPFFEFNQKRLIKKCLPMVAFMGKYFPSLTVAGGFSEEYGKSIHKTYSGEWDYNLEWKPNVAPKVNLGWIRSIYKGQRELTKSIFINVPVLVMHSETSATDITSKDQIHTCDIILNVKDIDRIAHNIKGNVNIVSINGGLHDLILSVPVVRKNVYTAVFDWIKKQEL